MNFPQWNGATVEFPVTLRFCKNQGVDDVGVNREPLSKALRSPIGLRWLNWLGTVAVVSGIGALVIPLLRQYPEGLHAHLTAAPFTLQFIACELTTFGIVALLFRLLSPRLAHTRIFHLYPPLWGAVAISAILVAAVDLTIGLGPGEFRAAPWEWVVYGGGSAAIVAVYRRLAMPDNLAATPITTRPDDATVEELLQDWTRLERWLQREVAAEDDLLGNRGVARRLADYLFEGGGTVCLIGPFGSGKTSVVKWIGQEVERRNQEVEGRAQAGERRVWVCESVSCWGFEDSASAIQQILNKSIQTVGRHADCFSVRHLPESYRKTFSAGGDWVRNLADLMVGTGDPLEQFQTLSDILALLNARLVIVVEDLDRTSSTRFDRQEVLALLERLKKQARLAFVLTGGPAANTGIDYPKLSERIELLREFDQRTVSRIVEAVRARCLTAFPEDVDTHPRDNPWHHLRYAILNQFDITPLPSALAGLLKTPRGLKHALRHSYQAWQRLHGEIDFDHLLVVNTIRHAATEVFDFLWRHWGRLHDDPSQWRTQHDQRGAIAARLREEWGRITRAAEWDARAAQTLIEFILPPAAHYLNDDEHFRGGERTRLQGMTEERYWLRAVNEDIDRGQVRDQVAIRDMQDWYPNRNPVSPLIEGLVRGGDYAGRWERFAGEWDGATLLCLADHVFAHYRNRQGTRQANDDLPPDAFAVIWRQAHRRVPRDAMSAEWLERQVRDAMPCSLMLVLDLYYYWASPRNGIVQLEDRNRIRRLILELAHEQYRSAEDLIRVVHSARGDLYRLVYLRGDDEDHIPSVCRGPEHWSWLGPIILDALRQQQTCSHRRPLA